jgi:hypothetical protein
MVEAAACVQRLISTFICQFWNAKPGDRLGWLGLVVRLLDADMVEASSHFPEHCGFSPLSLRIDLILSPNRAAMLRDSAGGIMPDPIAKRLATLPMLSKTELRELWRELFKAPPSPQLRSRLMIAILAYRLQEQEFGSLATASRGRLRQLARSITPNSNCTLSSIPTLKAGTRLVRQWGDEVHLVNVDTGGYEYKGARYKSLSEIARLITGTRWSGPLFFGIKSESVLSKPQEAQ